MLLSALLPDPDGLELEQVINRPGLVSLVLRATSNLPPAQLVDNVRLTFTADTNRR
jgi:hypothetical protein